VTARHSPVEEWFLAHGLPYFVAEERAAAHAGLRPRRLVPLLVLLVVVAATAGGLLGWASDTYTAGPAVWITVMFLGLLWYAATALHARPILGFALSRTLGSLRFLVPMASRALPLLLVFVTFLFVNAEAWEMTTNLPFGLLWFTVLLMFGLAVLFLMTRLPEEVDRVDDEVDDAFVVRACAGTPLEQASREVAADPSIDPQDHAQVAGFERWNLILALVVIQVVQVLLLTLTVFAFLLIFGAMIMTEDVMESWLGTRDSGLTVELVQVSTFLAAFSGLYLTVSTVTEETYRAHFFGDVQRELERAVGVRAVYLALRARQAP